MKKIFVCLLLSACFSFAAETRRTLAECQALLSGTGGTGENSTISATDLRDCVIATNMSNPRNAQTGTTYTFLAADRGKLVTLSNAAAIAVTLPQAGTTGFEDGWMTYVRNVEAGLVTITPTTSTINGATSITIGTNNQIILFSDGTNYVAFNLMLAGQDTNFFGGRNSGAAITTGTNNVAIGNGAFDSVTIGDVNVAIGFNAMTISSTASGTRRNTVVGAESGNIIDSGQENTLLGYRAGNTITSGDYNTYIGSNSGAAGGASATAQRNIFIGAFSGVDETGSNTLMIDNQDRGNEATGRLQAILYGIMAALPINQTLTVNAAIRNGGGFNFTDIDTGGAQVDAPNGSQIYCNNCDPTSGSMGACTSAGAASGAMAFKIGGSWACLSQ